MHRTLQRGTRTRRAKNDQIPAAGTKTHLSAGREGWPRSVERAGTVTPRFRREDVVTAISHASDDRNVSVCRPAMADRSIIDGGHLPPPAAQRRSGAQSIAPLTPFTEEAPSCRRALFLLSRAARRGAAGAAGALVAAGAGRGGVVACRRARGATRNVGRRARRAIGNERCFRTSAVTVFSRRSVVPSLLSAVAGRGKGCRRYTDATVLNEAASTLRAHGSASPCPTRDSAFERGRGWTAQQPRPLLRWCAVCCPWSRPAHRNEDLHGRRISSSRLAAVRGVDAPLFPAPLRPLKRQKAECAGGAAVGGVLDL